MEKIADKNVDIAKKIITEEVEKAGYQVDRIILFGSRVRGDYKEDSDYDLFIILKQNILERRRRQFYRRGSRTARMHDLIQWCLQQD